MTDEINATGYRPPPATEPADALQAALDLVRDDRTDMDYMRQVISELSHRVRSLEVAARDKGRC